MNIEKLVHSIPQVAKKTSAEKTLAPALALEFGRSGPYFEHKYLVRATELQAVRTFLVHYFSSVREFGEGINKTTYFDTGRWDLLQANEDGNSIKTKIRLRENVSPGSNRVSLEVKHRLSGQVSKRRVVLSKFEERWLGDLPLLVSRLDAEMAFDLTSGLGVELGSLHASLFTQYKRERFVGLGNGMRANLDTGLEATHVSLSKISRHAQRVLLPFSVLEVKSPTPPELPREFRSLGLVRTTLSKYHQTIELYRSLGVLR